MPAFSYDEAFSRNIGRVAHDEQQRLRHKRVVFDGKGGVSGFHLLALARLGIAQFYLADFDAFNSVNRKRLSINHGPSSLSRCRNDQYPNNPIGSRSSPCDARRLPLRLPQQAESMFGKSTPCNICPDAGTMPAGCHATPWFVRSM